MPTSKAILNTAAMPFVSALKLSLKDLFRENFYFIIRFYTLRTSKIH